MSLVKACDYFYTSVIFLLYQLIEVLFAFELHIDILLKYLRISALLSIALLVHHIYSQILIIILKFLRFSAFISAVGLLSLFSARNFPNGQIRVTFHRSFDPYHTGLHIALRLLIGTSVPLSTFSTKCALYH